MKGVHNRKAHLALISVCFFWGTTYVAIRMALETLPPMFLVGARFLLSGSLMVAGSKLLGYSLPRGKDFFYSLALGVAILGVGNGCLVIAEMWIPSGMAALIITTSPFWMIGVEALMPGGEKLHAPTLAGLIVGFAGTLMLVGPGAINLSANSSFLRGFLVLQGSILFWVFFSMLQKRYKTGANPIVTGGVHQLGAGIAASLVAAAFHQWPQAVSGRSLMAALYLVVFGSIVGYSSYVYALNHLPVAVLSLYNYVNPVVAVALGWMFYREPFGLREAAAMATIFVGVALVKQHSPQSGAGSPRGAAVPEDGVLQAVSPAPAPSRPMRRPAK